MNVVIERKKMIVTMNENKNFNSRLLFANHGLEEVKSRAKILVSALGPIKL